MKNGQTSIRGAALIEKAFRLIETVGRYPGSVTVRELQQDTGWPRATLHRIVSAVESHGYLRFDPIAKGYTLGFRFMELAQNVWSGSDIVSVASLELRRLRDITGETAYLAVPRDYRMVGLGKFEGAHAVRSTADIGIRKPMYCTSQGKAVLAFLPSGELDDYFRHVALEPYTPKTLCDVAELLPQLMLARQRGYAIEDEEIIVGNRCVGAPILDGSGKPIAAISVAGPVWRLTRERVEQLGPEIASAARAIGVEFRAAAPRGDARSEEPAAHPGTHVSAFYGADPHWDERRKLLLWTDRMGPALHETRDRATRTLRLPQDTPIEAVTYDGEETRIWQRESLVSVRDGQRRVLDSDVAPVGAAACDSRGTVWTARPGADGSIVASADGACSVAVAGSLHSLAVTGDGETLYAADPDRGVVYLVSTSTSRVRVFTRVPGSSGKPRALALDRRGRLWAALDEGWSVVRFSADGEIEHVVALPVPRPTGLAFGGDGGGDLFVTSARVGLNRETLANASLSGRLLVVRTAL